MTFNLKFPTQDAATPALQLSVGEILFVLGANGSGKSNLMYRFNRQNLGRARKIAAHRQTWMNSDLLDMTSSTKVQTEQHIQNEDRHEQSRYRDSYASQRASMTIYELIDAENNRARSMAAAYDAGDMDRLEKVAKADAPITIINEILKQSNIPIKIMIRNNERLMASKNGCPEYSAAELSDGERNALLIAGNVLTAPRGTLLIIDEPERHLHRSIISPLLGQLFSRRTDCGFVVSTHDHDLPLGHRRARTLLLRDCSFNGKDVRSWEADELPVAAPIDDILKRDLLGARRKVLFVEGTESSLDKSIYSVVFPMTSVIPKGSAHEVEQAVVGARAAEDLHWLRVFGIADGDGLDANQVATKRARGVYALPYYSVEAIYFHPKIVQGVARRQASVLGGDSEQLAENAIRSGIDAIRGHTHRLSQKAAKKILRQSVVEQIPNDDDLLAGESIQIANNSERVLAERQQNLDAAVAAGNWAAILITCPVRESNALEEISKTLQFRQREAYEQAVRHLLAEDSDLLDFVRGLFGNLAPEILN